MQILYDMLNKRTDTFCERLFSPWVDMDKLLREKDIALFSLESQEEVRKADFLGITLQYEMCYTNILQILELSKIAFRAVDRGEDEPIVIGGGPCTYNPEPLADFFDLFYIGEGEVVYDSLLDMYKEYKTKGKSRKEFLRAAAKLEGIYVPSFYTVEYDEDGFIKSREALEEYFVSKGLDKNKLQITYCTTGVRASYVAVILEELGYKVRNYEPSFARYANVGEVE